MSTKLQIRVTKAILNKSAYCGHVKSEGQYIASDDETVSPGTNCAIALAVRDIFPEAHVSGLFIYPFGLNIPDIIPAIPLPTSAIFFIQNFDDKMPDQRRKMEPFEFEIDVPDNVLQHAFPIEADLKEIFKEHATLRFI